MIVRQIGLCSGNYTYLVVILPVVALQVVTLVANLVMIHLVVVFVVVTLVVNLAMIHHVAVVVDAAVFEACFEDCLVHHLAVMFVVIPAV